MTGIVDGVARRTVKDIVTESATGVLLRVVSGIEEDGVAVVVVVVSPDAPMGV